MFGDDINNQIPMMNYTKKNGDIIKMDFYTFFPTLMRDYLISVFELQNQIFPFLFTKGWLYPNNINEKNCNELRNTVKEFLEKHSDKDSIYSQLINNEGFKPDDIFDDIIGLLHAAHQTSHHTVCSILYFIKKDPQWFEKLRSELNQVGVNEKCDYNTAVTRDVIQDTQSLTLIVKEALRIDPAGSRSLIYTAYEDIQICGVPIPKGSKIEQWPDPETFKPERFDPLSEHYYISEDKKTPRNPFSYIPFSFGVRKCPGMILALTEIKALICYLATKVDYSIDKELLENDNVRFGIYTNFNLILNIDKIR